MRLSESRSRSLHRRRSVILIAGYGTAIAIVARVVYEIVFVQRDGPVIWKGYGTHGLHEGDLPAIIIGLPLILLMLLGIFREARALRRGWNDSP